jgi:outer membrane protein OmpA-like peptidoglycan-associated protein
MRKSLLPLLLLSAAVCAAPASANYFSNPRAGTQLNIGSAPNPKPSQLRNSAPIEEPSAPRSEPAVAAPVPYSPPATVISEAPPAAPPPAVQHFVVFFDFDKSNLTEEARAVVERAVSAAKQAGQVRIVVIGHTDTVGSFRYNQALSERRAESVRSEMVRLGMDNAEISTTGRSFSDPLIPTGPGIREPQNRRATIDIGGVPIAEAF